VTSTDDVLDQLAASGAATPGKTRLVFVGWLLAALLTCTAGAGWLLTGAFATIEENGIGPMLVKWGFSLSRLRLCVIALQVLGKPERRGRWPLLVAALPFIPVLLLLSLELATVGPMIEAASWPRCLLAMAVMSPIGFAGAVLAMRSMAPTGLREAGLVAGLFGGAVAMTAFAPYCAEHGMTFMIVYYCLPIMLMAGLGWILGPRLLRW
jgi:hypothetical protein